MRYGKDNTWHWSYKRVRENFKSKIFVIPNIQEIGHCKKTKRPNLKIIRIEEGEESSQLKGSENTLNKFTGRK